MARNKLFHRTALALFGGALAGITSCSSSPTELTIQLEDLAPSDTIAYVTYSGTSGQMTDTLLHFPKKVVLAPDTALYQVVSFVHSNGEQIRFYAWDGKQWKSQDLVPVRAPQTESSESFIGKDIQGKERSFPELYTKHPVELIFVSPETLHSLTKAEQKKLQQEAKPDSLTFVFLYPTPSDSTARRFLLQDSLQGIAFSDSLGLVTDLRQRYGVAQEAKAIRLRIDTLGKVHR